MQGGGISTATYNKLSSLVLVGCYFYNNSAPSGIDVYLAPGNVQLIVLSYCAEGTFNNGLGTAKLACSGCSTVYPANLLGGSCTPCPSPTPYSCCGTILESECTFIEPTLCYDVACPVQSNPTTAPIQNPTLNPSKQTSAPSVRPSLLPKPAPILAPSPKPKPGPNLQPTFPPISGPTLGPARTSSPIPLKTQTPALRPLPSPTALPTAKPIPGPTGAPTAKPVYLPTPTPTSVPWFQTARYTELLACAGVVGLLTGAALACLFRMRLGRWPPPLRTTSTAIAVTSLGAEIIYSAAASSSAQFCGSCPSDAGWVILMMSFVVCGCLLAFRLVRLQLALEAAATLPSTFLYAPVVILAALDGDLIVWLPWIETDATKTLGGFPDSSSIAFASWSIALRKLPFLVFTAMNTLNSSRDRADPADILTLVSTAVSLTMSVSNKLLLRLTYANQGLNVFVGVNSDTGSIRSNSFRSMVGIELDGDQGTLGKPLIEDMNNDVTDESASQNFSRQSTVSAVSSRSFVNVAQAPVSSSGSVQTAGAAIAGTIVLTLIVTDTAPSFDQLFVIGRYVLLAISAILALVLFVFCSKTIYLALLKFFGRSSIRTSVYDALEKDLEAERMEAEVQRQAAEAQQKLIEEQRQVADALEAEKKEKERLLEAKQRHEQYVRDFVIAETGLDVSKMVLPLEEVKSRLAVLLPLLSTGEASGEEEQEAERLLNMLGANPERQREEAEARAAFLEGEEKPNSEALKFLRTHLPSSARSLRSEAALEAEGLSLAVARRLIRTPSVALILTPADEIATMHPSDLRKCGPQGLSLLELRAVVASLPRNFESDTAKGEKRAWADSFVEALKAMLARESSGNLSPSELCHPCYGSGGKAGPFDPTKPLLRRAEAVKSEPSSGAEAKEEAAAGAAGRVAERAQALREAGLGSKSAPESAAASYTKQPVTTLPRAANAASVSSLRERLTEGAVPTSSKDLASGLLAAIARRRKETE